ncbi:hypothetical protein ACROYT_G042305 [Oculina patagonica]
MDNVHNVPIHSNAKLNVGGHFFTTSVQTLTKDPNSMLAAMFSGKFEMKPSEDGSFFIDRDGTHFRFILNYLRTGKLTLPEGATFLKELEEEAEFYQIQGMIDDLRPSELTVQAYKATKAIEESEILTDEKHQSILNSWLQVKEGKWRLLFRASRDGFAARNFHTKCDNKGPTVTIVKSGNNIFGGFTDVSWASDRITWITCTQAFLFSIINPQGLRPTKMPISKYKLKGFFCDSSLGPTFGGNRDLQVISRNENKSLSGYSHLGFSFDVPPGQQATFLAGAKTFTVTDYEVFGLHT